MEKEKGYVHLPVRFREKCESRVHVALVYRREFFMDAINIWSVRSQI